MELTLAEWLDPQFQLDLAAYLQFLTDHTGLNGEADDEAFQFIAFDLAASGFERLETTVDGVSTNPEDEIIDALDDALSTDEDTDFSADALANNGGGADYIPDYLRHATLVEDSNGTLVLAADGTFTYDPSGFYQYLAVNESAVDTFTYEIEDADGDTDQATVSITVHGVNDVPVVELSDLVGALTELGVPAGQIGDSGSIGFTDADFSDTHSISAILDQTLGEETLGGLTASVTTDTTGTGLGGKIDWAYTVDATAVEYIALGETKIESFQITLDDHHGGTVERTVDVTITGTNDAPVAGSDTAHTLEDIDVVIDVLDNDTDVDASDTRHVSSVNTSTSRGSVSINANNTVTYTPAANFSGIDVFSYTVMDNNGATDTTTVEVTVEAVADEPQIDSTVDAGSSVYEVAVAIELSSVDMDGSESYSYVLSNIPANVSVDDDGVGNVLLTLPSNVDTDFDLRISATSIEASNGSTAGSSIDM